MNKIICLLLLFVLSISSVFAESDLPERTQTNYENGVVVEILSQKNNQALSEILQAEHIGQLLRVKILSGDLKGEEVTVENQLSSNPEFDINVKNGDRVLLSVEKFFKDYQVYVAAKDRSSVLIFLVSSFFLLLLIVGGVQGLKIIASVLASFLLIVLTFLMILNGLNPLLTTFLMLMMSAFVLKFILRGINPQTIAAALSTSLSLVFGCLMAFIFINLADLNGFQCEEAVILNALRPFLDNKLILMSSVLISAFGALLHVCSCVSYGIFQQKQKNPQLSWPELFSIGMQHGKDSITTMAVVLLYAYVGLMMFLFMMLCEIPFLKFINLNSVVIVIVTICIVSINLVLSIPVASFLSAHIVNKFYK